MTGPGRPAVTRSPLRLLPDPTRVLAKPYLPDEDPTAPETRVARLLRQLAGLPPVQVGLLLEDVRSRFAARHRDLEGILEHSFQVVAGQLDDGVTPDRTLRLLIGAYFTHEFTIEAAALFNPSMVPAPDQRDVPAGAQRFVLSLRAVGEGHLSSIEFRSGVVDAGGSVTLEPMSRFVQTGTRRAPIYDKPHFLTKLDELGVSNQVTALATDPLPERFTGADLDEGLERIAASAAPDVMRHEAANVVHWLASSNYAVAFPDTTPLAERVLFPESPVESRGMEDARFVRLVEDDGTVRYHATYTAYDGHRILPQLISTVDFTDFRVATLNGPAAANKGMALFPRRLHGRYVALSRYDRHNIDVMTSDNVHFWSERVPLRGPRHPWELFQMGNCGSPLETEAGWLVLTHGVGPLRSYSIGVLLLDLDDPTRIVADLPWPLLQAEGHEREGYVPNVVYSCGGMLHGRRLILPYGFSDAGTGFASVDLDDLLACLADNPAQG